MKYYSRVGLNRDIWKHIQKTNIVLDIGPGLEPQRFFQPINSILCEPCPTYIEELERIVRPGDSIISHTAQYLVEILTPGAVESVFMLDVIEHMPKSEGLAVLKKLEGIASKQIVVRTPLDYCENDYCGEKDCWGHYELGWQKHQSEWHPSDFDDSWEILVCPHYIYILGDGSIHIPAMGQFFAIKNLSDSGVTAEINWLRKLIVSLYDCAVIGAAYTLRLLPVALSRWILRLIMRTVWRRVGV